MQRHFTSTAFVIDSQKRTLLLWHKRLQRWMPPGGHVDPDETPEEAARRECKEETGLDVDIIGDAQIDVFKKDPSEGQILKKPFAFLLEEIPECPERNEPKHQHMDFIYLARPLDENQVLSLAEEEAEEIHWFTKEEVRAIPKEKIYENVKLYILEALE